MDRLPEKVTVSDIAKFLGMTRWTAYKKIKQHRSVLPPNIQGAKTMQWYRDDIERYLVLFNTYKEQGVRVRVAFNKKNRDMGEKFVK